MRSLRRTVELVVFALVLATGGGAALCATPTPPAQPDSVTPTRGARPATRTAEAGERQARRGIEQGGATASGPPPTERLLHIDLNEPKGCPIEDQPRLVAGLLALRNSDQLMSLEVWGDRQEYRPSQDVIYYLRSPRAVYVTLFWIGPRSDVFVPFDNLKVPGGRNVSVDADSVVVPPLGHERWVAVATLEPVHLPCREGERRWLELLARVRALPHAIGRWEVRSSQGKRQPIVP